MIGMISYDLNENIQKPYEMPEDIEKIEFTYCGGRLCLFVNGQQVFYTALAGNDCSIEIYKEE